MKSVLKYALGWGAAVLCLALMTLAQSPNGVHGAFTGSLQLPQPFSLTFGTGSLAGDVVLQKNGANVLGLTGDLGGSGAVANTTVSPAGPFAWGIVTLASNTATVTFAKPFSVTPICVVTDQTTPQLVKVAPTTTTAVITDTVGATDVVAYACFGNPN